MPALRLAGAAAGHGALLPPAGRRRAGQGGRTLGWGHTQLLGAGPASSESRALLPPSAATASEEGKGRTVYLSQEKAVNQPVCAPVTRDSLRGLRPQRLSLGRVQLRTGTRSSGAGGTSGDAGGGGGLKTQRSPTPGVPPHTWGLGWSSDSRVSAANQEACVPPVLTRGLS